MPTLHLEIVTVEGKVFDDRVSMVVAPGSEGVLGVLPRHAPLITALREGELQVKKEGQEDQFFAIGGGFMEVQPDHVVVLADAAERAEEIDVSRAEAARRRAEEFLSKAEKEEDFERAQAALRRSTIRLRVAERRRGRTPRQSRGPGDMST
ncbi:MAG TPA: F0F1 ATP synthase subunit epsilon [Anaerolineae bacterium]|nr:F0F1 ATP synthase subunit epsilon [Anaerolineae bacterium]